VLLFLAIASTLESTEMAIAANGASLGHIPDFDEAHVRLEVFTC
jgi:hypothetical protein